nr:hypothetical protein [uncultured Arsenicibacter sp.]
MTLPRSNKKAENVLQAGEHLKRNKAGTGLTLAVTGQRCVGRLTSCGF